MKIKLGVVGHFSIAVSDVRRAEEFWTKNFDMKPIFRFDDGVGLSNDAITIVPFKGTPDPDAIEHMSFHLRSMEELRSALDVLKKNGVEVEDPGDEIGPEAPGSPNYGLWFRDEDGYRWELSVQNAVNTNSG
jgi:catechol 2,3-dioxygenase-like lactoylglutathione lyase family enzyme